MENNVKETAESKHFPEPNDPQRNSGTVDSLLTLDASYQETFTKELDLLLIDAGLSLSSPVEGQNFVPTNNAAHTTSRVDFGAPPVQSQSVNEFAADPVDDEFFQNLLRSDALNQYSSDPRLQPAARSQSSLMQLDFPSFPTMPSDKSSLLPEKMQPPCPPIDLHPPNVYGNVRDYQTGHIFPNSYLDRIRAPVDPTFSNENWGDDYYFSDSCNFRYIEDFKPNPHQGVDREAIFQGLQLRAMSIPERTVEDSWTGFEASLKKLSNEDCKEKNPPTSVDEMERHLQRSILEAGRQPLPPDLEPAVQIQKIFHSRNAMQGINVATLLAPGINPFRVGTAPFVVESLYNDRRAATGRMGLSNRLQRMEMPGERSRTTLTQQRAAK